MDSFVHEAIVSWLSVVSMLWTSSDSQVTFRALF